MLESERGGKSLSRTDLYWTSCFCCCGTSAVDVFIYIFLEGRQKQAICF